MKKKITGNAKSFAWKKCCKCKKQTRRARIHKGNFYCYNCYRKFMTSMPQYDTNCVKLETALNKIREVKGYCYSKSSPHGLIFVPRVLIGKKVKLILAGKK